MEARKNIMAVSGNTAAAFGASLCGIDVVAAYPITPQSSVVEYLAGMVANGQIDAQMVQVESEHSAMSVVQGAAAAGGRVFTATSAQGLALMYEPYFRMSTLRFPMVMAIANREMTSPETIWSGQQDTMSVRDAGWIQVYCENNQEILDMIIQGYRLAEDQEVLLPVNVCYDGFFLSHMTERLEMPDPQIVSAFLPAYMPEQAMLDPQKALALDPLTPGNILMEYRKAHLEAMQRALVKLEDVDMEFGKHFGRSYGGAIEAYRLEDADIALLTIGSMTGTARVAVDAARNKGVKVGLIKVRYMRPFPALRIAKALKGKTAWAAIDRSVSFGWNSGPMFMETKAAANTDCCHFSAVGGLGGADISVQDVFSVINRLNDNKKTTGQMETLWLSKEI